jgi:hypothetical protein
MMNSNKLERDIGHQCKDAGECDSDGEPAIAVAARDEVSECDVAMAMAYSPEAGKHHHHVRVGNNRVGNCKEAHGACAIERSWHCDDRVGGIEIAADEKPCNPCSKAASG